jgi:hypothetical protein
MSDSLVTEITLILLAVAAFLSLVYGLLRGRFDTMPRGRVGLLGPAFGLRDHYTLRIEIADTLTSIDIWPAELPRLAAFLTSCDNGQGAVVTLSAVDHKASRSLLIPIWALPEARRLLAAAALDLQAPYESIRRQASA